MITTIILYTTIWIMAVIGIITVMAIEFIMIAVIIVFIPMLIAESIVQFIMCRTKQFLLGGLGMGVFWWQSRRSFGSGSQGSRRLITTIARFGEQVIIETT
jgi:hypothetical protein